ncbi:hypothetical protein [Kitasatospora sp. NPDC056181]|uniref:hypothetical protein n=1 Tax=Kitasatospora sp. NPDC056181 TaxID=3345737 RepID=UPI0035DA4837
MMLSQSGPGWAQLVMSSPLIAAAIAGIFAICIAISVTEAKATKRLADAASIRTDKEREDRQRAKLMLRHQLVDEAVAAVSVWYMCLPYKNARTGRLAELVEVDGFTQIHEQYMKSRSLGHALAVKLDAYYASEDLHRNWHAVMDLVSVRYHDAIGSLTLQLRQKNADGEHSGLTVGELGDGALVSRRFLEALADVMAEIVGGDISPDGHVRQVAGPRSVAQLEGGGVGAPDGDRSRHDMPA